MPQNEEKSNVDSWLEKATAPQRMALENASRHFGKNDSLTVNTLEAIYGRESSFGSRRGTRGIDGAAGDLQFEKKTAQRIGLTVLKKNDQRFDINKALDAAARYLKKLDDSFAKETRLGSKLKTIPVENADERKKFAIASFNGCMRLKALLFQKIFFSFIGIFLFVGLANAGEKVSLDLKQLHSDPISKVLRQTFDEYLKNESVDGLSKEMHAVTPSQLRLFGEKFIVLGIEEGGAGGYFVTIFIAPRKMFCWKLWLYPTDEKEYQIHEIERIVLNEDEMKEFKSLQSGEYLEYWL